MQRTTTYALGNTVKCLLLLGFSLFNAFLLADGVIFLTKQA